MQTLSIAEIEQVSGGWDLAGVIPLSWSLPAGPGGSDVTLYGAGYDFGGTTVGFGRGEGGTFGIEVVFTF